MFCETEKNSLKNRYVRTRFGTEQGLFVDLVDDIVQSRDGFLWLRENGSGISRFDGQHFVSTTGLGTVQALAAAPNGDLWVSTSEDLKQIRENDLGRFGKSPFVIFSFGPHNGVTALHFTRDGVLWIGTKKGLYRSENGSFAPVMQGPYIQRIDERANGQLWVMTGDGPMQWDGRRVVPHPELASELGVNAKDIFHVFEDSHGVTWLSTSYGVARHVSGAMEKLEPWGPKGYQKLQGYEDPRGRIWFAMQQGLFQLTAHGLELVAGWYAGARYVRRSRRQFVGWHEWRWALSIQRCRGARLHHRGWIAQQHRYDRAHRTRWVIVGGVQLRWPRAFPESWHPDLQREGRAAERLCVVTCGGCKARPLGWNLGWRAFPVPPREIHPIFEAPGSAERRGARCPCRT
jgi:Two component regulator propeller